MCRKEVDGTWTPRFGKGRIIAMLQGSKSREVLDAGLDELTTYGLLKHVGQAGLQSIFQEMEKLALVQTITEGDYPLLTITDKGSEIMRKGGDVRMQWPSAEMPKEAKKRTAKGVKEEEVVARELGFDEALFERLKKKRNEIAQREGVPSYVIFHNTTLEFFTRLKPSTLEAGKKIRGVGEAKAEKWLAEFLPVIAEH
jgi:ATP-dependent DNA helicase RecQ